MTRPRFVKNVENSGAPAAGAERLSEEHNAVAHCDGAALGNSLPHREDTRKWSDPPLGFAVTAETKVQSCSERLQSSCVLLANCDDDLP